MSTFISHQSAKGALKYRKQNKLFIREDMNNETQYEAYAQCSDIDRYGIFTGSLRRIFFLFDDSGTCS